MVDGSAVHPGGDGDILLGTADHRWSEVHATNGTVQTSDRRLKTSIHSLSYGLDEILRLSPVSYRWKDRPSAREAGSNRHLGLIAQQVQDVVGEVVEEPSGDGGYLGMRYSELIPVLIKAIQQQQTIIEQQKQILRSRDDAIQSKVRKLQQKVRALADQIEEGETLHARPVDSGSTE